MADAIDRPPSRIVATTADVIAARGIPRRDFLGFCSVMAMMLGLGPTGWATVARALETKPRIPVLWLHGHECTCCSESFIRSSHPQVSDVVLSMISLDYDDTIMAASGTQAESIVDEIMRDCKGSYILAVEGNVPLANNGWNCIVGGRPFHKVLNETARNARAIISWGTCASFGCVQAAKPNPSQSTPIYKLVKHVPVINVPGCPPIAEVMTGILTYILAFDRLPELDTKLRPRMFYGQRIHDKCYRRAHFDAGQFVESWDDEGARLGYCLYKMGCRGPTTYNACSTIGWNDGLSFPIKSGHGCIGCSEDGFWDRGPFYERLPHLHQFGIESTADKIGLGAVVGLGAAVAVHAAISAIKSVAERSSGKEEDTGHPRSNETDNRS
ncbi:MAG: hydrogenase small subunit [Bradyrhizobium sp.]|uniref:hydrogenase small subunit n=1 Tax=Bradyrhizobium sp. TaxID=376 RepID=UPI0025BDF004|nr:hydrogenase small subunit [Bradyrhizobium sp.]MBI5260240.1 hydrogenase small subunit [Bradyrhizobium sp.]